MGYEYRIEIGAPQPARLDAGGHSELVCDDGNRGNTSALERDAVVQTARCARPSVGQCLDDSVGKAESLQELRRGGLRVGWLGLSYEIHHAVAFAQQLLQPLQKHAAAALADVEERDRLAPLWQTACMTGLRRSELCGLQWPDIDLDAGVLSVKRARVQIDGGKLKDKAKELLDDAGIDTFERID